VSTIELYPRDYTAQAAAGHLTELAKKASIAELASWPLYFASAMKAIARSLLESGSVCIRPEPPFRLASGRLSPVYVDCRRLISFPQIRRLITTEFARIIREKIGVAQVEIIAGGETAGIPYAAWLAAELELPLIYVRKQPKGHGKSSQIEGVLSPGQRVVLVEDLVTDGGSKLLFKRGIEAAGGLVANCLCVFEYRSRRAGLAAARQGLAAQGLKLFSLCDWDELLELAQAESDVGQVLDFLGDPDGWSRAHEPG